MPVAINGTSGVITGVATGGLPDGIVDTDMLAAGAVTAAKRGSGAILQVKMSSAATGNITGSGTSISTVSTLNVNITPIAAGSKFLLQATGINGHVNMEGSTGNHGCKYFFYASVNSGTFADVNSSGNSICHTYLNAGIGSWKDLPVHYSYLASPSYSLGQSIDFRPAYGKPNQMGNDKTFYFNHDTQSGNEMRLIVLEVAA